MRLGGQKRRLGGCLYKERLVTVSWDQYKRKKEAGERPQASITLGETQCSGYLNPIHTSPINPYLFIH